MKKGLFVLGLAAISFVACKKDECHACHYELSEERIELGQKCGDDLKQAETAGMVVDGVKYDIHCHEH